MKSSDANIQQFQMPDFLLAEHPIKDGSIEAGRMFIYCPKLLCLIEIVALDDMEFVPEGKLPSMQFTYDLNNDPEDFMLILVQNNLEAVNEITGDDTTPDELLIRAWKYFEKYLEWEDGQSKPDP